MKFYHVSPNKNLKGKSIKRTKNHPVVGKYACLCTCIEQAYYWISVLNDPEKMVTIWHIYEVDVPDDAVVYDCLGYYLFEISFADSLRATRSLACKVVPHIEYDRELMKEPGYYLDGEVAVTEEYAVTAVVDTIIK